MCHKSRDYLMICGVLFTAGFLNGCNERKSTSNLDTQRTTAPKTTPSADSSVVESAAGVHDVKLNENLIPMKVLPIRHGVRCQDRPNGNACGEPLGYFLPYFVFETEPQQGPAAYYQIGATPRRDSIQGWVPAAAVVRWDTRVGARYGATPGVRMPPLLVYGDPEALVQLLKTGNTSDEPIARAVAIEGRPYMPWPIIESRQVVVDGVVHDLVKLAFLAEFKVGVDLGENPSPTTEEVTYTPSEVAAIKGGIRMLDVVFVLDITGSMKPYAEAVKEVIRRTIRELGRLPYQPDIAYGLVSYRDYKDSGLVTKSYDLDNNLPAFLQRIGELQCAAGGDTSEAVYDGVYDALETMKWRGGGLSTRIIVLIGDCSAHEPGDAQNPRNISRDQLTTLANRKDRHVKLFALAVGGRGSNGDPARRWEQFSDLANRTGAACFTVEEASKVVERIGKIVDGASTTVKANVVIVDELQAGKTAKEIGRDAKQIQHVMELLRGAGYDPRRLGPGTPTFAEGWVLCDFQGVSIVKREVYLAREEIGMLLSILNLVGSGPEAIQQVIAVSAPGRTGSPAQLLGEFFSGQLSETPLNLAMEAVLGIPAGPRSILRLTRNELTHMPEERRRALVQKISHQYVPQLTNARTNEDYWRYRDDVEYGWIPEEYLP